MGVKMRQKDGKWYVFINHKDRRKAKCVGDSKRAAEEVKRKLEAKLTLGEFALQDEKPAVPTFQEYAEEWLGTYVKLNCKESTYARYAIAVRKHLLPVFGAAPLTTIAREDVKRFIYHTRETAKLSPASVQVILTPLRHILNQALEDGLLTSNPVVRVGRFVQRRKTLAPAIVPLTREELTLFLETVQTARPDYYPLFLCLARSGRSARRCTYPQPSCNSGEAMERGIAITSCFCDGHVDHAGVDS